MQIPGTNDIRLRDWVEATSYVVGQYANVTQMQGDDWRSWGLMFFNSPQLGSLHPPNPYEYDTWQDWGGRLSESLLNARGSQHK